MSFQAKFILLASVCAALLPGCGQRGPLYLPDQATEAAAAQTATPQATPPAPDDAGTGAESNTDTAADEDNDAGR